MDPFEFVRYDDGGVTVGGFNRYEPLNFQVPENFQDPEKVVVVVIMLKKKLWMLFES